MIFLPLGTISISGLAILTYLSPSLTEVLIYDRQAILDGEVWRLLTGHCVHFTSTHVFYNLIGFGIAGSLLEYRGYPYFGLLCFLMANTISMSLLITQPQLSYYGGLSGLVSGIIVYTALWGLQEGIRWRIFCQWVLAIICVKISWELWQSAFIFNDLTAFVPVPQSHLVGSLTACGLFLIHPQSKKTSFSAKEE